MSAAIFRMDVVVEPAGLPVYLWVVIGIAVVGAAGLAIMFLRKKK